jgi:hypothetical protein
LTTAATMAARTSTELEDYNTQCELNECRWEYRRANTSSWSPFPEKDHKIIETAHILKEGHATIAVRGGFSSQTTVDLKRREFSAGYGNTYVRCCFCCCYLLLAGGGSAAGAAAAVVGFVCWCAGFAS